MRINELKLIRYGKFTDRILGLPASDRDIHLIVGPNEAGKSTIRNAIGDWLFGIPMRTSLAFLHPMAELRIGGVLERSVADEAALERLAFDRIKGNKNTLRTPADVNLPDGVLQSWLGSLKASTFNQMYALDHAILVEGGTGILSASDDIGRMLFQSAAGIEHLGDVLKKIENEADALWAPRKSNSRVYYQALDAYDAAHAEFKQATLRAKDWTAQHDALLSTEKMLVKVRADDIEIRQQLSRLERIRRVRPMLLTLDEAIDQHNKLLSSGDIYLLEESAAEALGDAREIMFVVTADLKRLMQDIICMQSELEQTHVNRIVLSLSTDITELNEQRLQFRNHHADIVKRSEEIRGKWLRVQELTNDLGWVVGNEDDVRQRLPSTLARLRLVHLLKERLTVSQDQQSAQSTLAKCQQQIGQAQSALRDLTTHVVHPGLATNVEQATQLGDHVTAMSELQRKIDDLSRSIDGSLAALGVWRKEPDSLIEMIPPELTFVQNLIDQHRSATLELQGGRDQLKDKTQDLQRLELELQQFVHDFQPVSKDQVQETRRVRDEAWRLIKATPQELTNRAIAFEGHIIDADYLADARLDRAQHEADRQAKTKRIEYQHLELQNQASKLQAIEEQMDDRLTSWHELTNSCGLPQLPLEIAPVWFQNRQKVLDLINEKVGIEQRQLMSREVATKAQQTLCSMLGVDLSKVPVPELAECIRQARTQITIADQAQGRRNTLLQQTQEGQSSLTTLQAVAKSTQDHWNTWNQAWQTAILTVGYEASISVEQVEAEIEVMQEVEQLLTHIRSIRNERIDTMQADLDGLANAAKSLSERIAPELQRDSPEEITLELTEQLEQARQAEIASAGLKLRLDLANAELKVAQQKQVAIQARLTPLMMSAGIYEEDLNALGRAIDRSDQRRDIERKIHSAQADLRQLADGLSPEDLRREISEIGPDELISEIEKLTTSSNIAVDEIAKLSSNYGTQKITFDAINGGDLGAKAEARRQESISTMADAVERFLKLHMASRLLKWSTEKFRETKQGPMLAKASTIFNELTSNSFSRLLVDSEEAPPRLLGIRPDGKQVDVTGMSEGTRDQLYLALRLAALDLQIEQGLNMPLIADDLFINFDDTRTAAGLKVLNELSSKMQVIFLTHHDHLVPLAREVLGDQLNVVYL
jgi:uncharacterized protein YhaN